MSYYAIYDVKTGHIVHTHFEVDVSGRHKTLTDDDVLSQLPPHIDRATVGVVPFDRKRESGIRLQVDLKTRKVATTPTPIKKTP
jgi:hypothetical protein